MMSTRDNYHPYCSSSSDENLTNDEKDYEYQQYLHDKRDSDNNINNSTKKKTSFSSSKKTPKFYSVESNDSDSVLSFTTRSSLGTTLSNGGIPLPPSPHIPVTTRKISGGTSKTIATASTSSISSSASGISGEKNDTSSSLSDHLNSWQRHDKNINNISKQETTPHLPCQNNSILGNNNRNITTGKNYNHENNSNSIDNINSAEDIYRRSIEHLAKSSNIKDDTSVVSRLSFKAQHSQDFSQNSYSKSKINTSDTTKPYHDNDDEGDDGSWYDPDTMQRMSTVPLDNETLNSLQHDDDDEYREGSFLDENLRRIPPKFNALICCKSRPDNNTVYMTVPKIIICTALALALCLTLEIVLHRGSNTTSTKIPMAPLDLMNLMEECTSSNNPTLEQYKHCQAMCLQASCCVEPNKMSDYCFEDSVDECLSYQPCVAIHLVYGMLTPEAAVYVTSPISTETDQNNNNNDDKDAITKNVISEACSLDSYETELGRAQCVEYCAPSACCFSKNFGCWGSHDSAYSHFYGSHLCHVYSECTVVFSDSAKIIHNKEEEKEDLEVISKTVAHLCDASTWEMQEDEEVCKDLCLPSQCCFTSTTDPSHYNCLHSHPELCAMYLSCNVLYDGGFVGVFTPENTVVYDGGDAGHDSFDSSITKEEDDTSTLNYFNDTDSYVHIAHSLEEIIESACSPNTTFDQDNHFMLGENNNNGDNTALECIEVCQPSQCCFHTNPEKNCWDDSEVMCDIFAPCEILREELVAATKTLHVISDVVQMVCGNLNELQTDTQLQQLCEEICLPYSCCFVTNGNDNGIANNATTTNNGSACEDSATASFCSSYEACGALSWTDEPRLNAKNLSNGVAVNITIP